MAELTRQLHLPICTLASKRDILNLTLHWMAHRRVKSDVFSGKVSREALQLDHWVQIPATLENLRMCGLTLECMYRD